MVSIPTQPAHPFINRPNFTLLGLMFPVLLSLIAEPVTGLVDTAFIARLGTNALAALGIATTALSSMFWIFSFLTVGTQTQISQAVGSGKKDTSRQIISLALMVGWGLSILVMAVFFPLADTISVLLKAEGEVRSAATIYTQIRLLGTPAIFTAFVCFGALRGDQDMRTPSIIAVAINVFNIVLDYPLVFGMYMIPAMGVAGAALASTISQWIGAIWILTITLKRFGFSSSVKLTDVQDLFSIGGNLFLRTGTLILFLVFSTRVANGFGAESGAAHQVIRQIYVVTALALDAFAVSAQSLVGYFIGGKSVSLARRAASLSIGWSIGTGLLLTALMLLSTNQIIRLMVPDEIISIFLPAWIITAIVQPLNALAFSTDGIHMGTSDYGYLRNAMFTATGISIAGLLFIPSGTGNPLAVIWIITAVWVAIRSIFGLLRVYMPPPDAPLAKVQKHNT